MPDYRRNRVPGGTFFFTVNLLDRRSNLLVARIDALRGAVRQVRARAPFHIDAWVVLPDHMHCLWTPAFAGAGCCRKAMPIFPVGGGRSRPRLQNRRRSASRDRRSWPAEANAAFGSDAIGSTRSAMTATSRPTWTTRISTRSSTVLWRTRRIGLTRRFIGALPAGYTLPAGRAAAMNRNRPANGSEAKRRKQAGGRGGRRSGSGRPTGRGGMRCAVPPYAC